jgi:hypothetical protein
LYATKQSAFPNPSHRASLASRGSMAQGRHAQWVLVATPEGREESAGSAKQPLEKAAVEVEVETTKLETKMVALHVAITPTPARRRESRVEDGAGRSAQSGSGAASKASGLNEDDETGKALAYRREVLLMVRHCMERQVTRLSEAEDIASPCRGIRSLFLPSSIATAEAGETSASGTKLRNKATVGEGVAAEADGESASFHWNAKAVEFVPSLAPLPSVVSKRGLLPRTPPGNWWAASVHPARPVAVGLQPGTRPHAAELRPKCLKPVAQACKPTAKTFNPQATEFVPGQAGQRQVHKSMTYSEDAQSAGAESESTSAGEEDALSCTEVGAQSPIRKQSAPWECW